MSSIVCLGALTALSVLACAGRAGPFSNASSRCQSADSASLAAAVAIAEADPPVASLWPGFWTRPTFGFYLKDSAALVVADQQPKGFKSLECEEASKALAKRLWVPDENDKYYQSGFVPIRGESGFEGAIVQLMSTQSASVDFAAHESFHMYQITRFRTFMEPPLGRELPDSLSLGHDFASRLSIELQALGDAVTAATSEDRRIMTLSYLAMRSARLGDYPLAAAVERKMEMIEGSAQYVGLRAVASTHSPSRSTMEARRSLAAQLRGIANKIRIDSTDIRDLRPRTYYSGAALAFLLDDSHPGWQHAVERGMPLDALVSSSFAR